MPDPQQDYLAIIFLKVSSLRSLLKKSLDFSFNLLSNTYPNIPSEELQELKQKYSVDEYISRVVPIITSQFTTDELKKLISFYGNGLGKKLIETDFGDKMKKVGDDLFSEMRDKFDKSKEN